LVVRIQKKLEEKTLENKNKIKQLKILNLIITQINLNYYKSIKAKKTIILSTLTTSPLVTLTLEAAVVATVTA
jgi:hypothetical protein